MTRQNKVPVNLSGLEGHDFTLALIPYWDMGNHAYPTTPEDRPDERARLVAATVYNAEHERLECFLDGPDPAPEAGPSVPIFIVYGQRTDAEFLVHNGFVIARNPHTSLKRLFKLNPEDPLYKERSHLMKLLGIPTEGTFTFGYPTLGHVSPELIAIARVSSMNEQELELYTTMEVPQRNELIDYETAHRPDLMNRANLWLAKSMRTRLQGYPTTIEQDEALVETQNRQMHPIRRLLIEYRLEEKRLLQSYVTLACDELKRLMAEIKLGTKQSQQFVEK
ncbi:actin-histidine N-methyltransferase-like [Anopheles ziemanni]|uniref:actin-histidine N-methyltransferase-like n=1 Tax=Anopheles coustani TaxID=139045 RepID=UPI00265A51D2|nr:actin-histidine N-methyltransferase-like [Anopheles coustani]XP_058169029.1 actin-histidine N-methyltransferase-like [Anopheles ziemanni]